MTQFRIVDWLNLDLGRTLGLTDWDFTQTEVGVGGMTAHCPPLRALKQEMIADRHGIVVVEEGTATWAGVLRDRSYDDGELILEFEEANSLFYDRVMDPAFGDWVRLQNTFSAHWAGMVNRLRVGERANGFPTFEFEMTENLNRIDMTARAMTRYGHIFDNLMRRTAGFPWWTTYDISEDQLKLIFTLNVGPRGRHLPEVLAESVRQTDGSTSGSILEYSIPESSSAVRTVVYMTGEGQPPDVPWSVDEDPEIGRTKIRREITMSRGNVKSRNILNRHAREERRYRRTLLSEATITLPADKPDYTGYSVGDRVRLNIQDEWNNVKFPAVRIISKKVKGSTDAAETVELVLDLDDYDSPGEDTGSEVQGG